MDLHSLSLPLHYFLFFSEYFLSDSHDVLHFLDNFLVYIVMRLIRVDLVQRALLTLMSSCFQLEKLGWISAFTLVRWHNDAIAKQHIFIFTFRL